MAQKSEEKTVETQELKVIPIDEVKRLTLTERLWLIMSEMPTMKKSGRHKFGNYNYVPHDNVTNEIRKFLIRYRILAIPTVTKHSRENSLTAVEMDIRLINIDDIQDTYTVHGVGTSVMDNDKASGAAISYAVKYAYLKLFHIETGEPDTDDHGASGSGDDKVYDPSKMGDFLIDFFLNLEYTPERIKKVWEENGKDWKLVEQRARKSNKAKTKK